MLADQLDYVVGVDPHRDSHALAVVDATRAGVTGPHEAPVWLSLLVAATVASTVFTVATLLVARGWRLKPYACKTV